VGRVAERRRDERRESIVEGLERAAERRGCSAAGMSIFRGRAEGLVIFTAHPGKTKGEKKMMKWMPWSFAVI